MNILQKKSVKITVIALVAVLVAASIFVGLRVLPKRDTYLVNGTLEQPFFSFDPAQWTGVLRVSFSQSVIQLDNTTTSVDASKIKITPSIDGTWSWAAQDTLLFEPTENWAPNTTYHIQFLSGFFNKNIRFEQTRFQFSTPKLSLELQSLDFIVDAADEKKKYLTAEIDAAFKVPPTELAALMNIKVAAADQEDTFYGHNMNIPFTLSLDEQNQVYRLVSRDLPAPYGTTAFTFNVSGKISNTNLKIEKTVQVEGLQTAARIINAEIANIRNANGGFDQTLIIESSVMLRPSDIENFLTMKVISRDDSRLKTMSETEVFAQTEPTPFKLAKATVPVSFLNGYLFNAQPGSTMRLEVKRGAAVYGGYIMNQAFNKTIQVPSFNNAVGFQGEGNILSSAGEKKLSLYAIGYNSLYMEVSRIQDDQVHHLISQTYGDFINLDFSNYEFTEQNISTVYEEEILLASPETFGTPAYFSVDLDRYLKLSKTQQPKRGLFAVSVYRKKTDRNPLVKKFVMISDIGMIQKRNTDGSADVFVQSFSTGKPIENVSVEVVGVNGVSIVKKMSDRNGRVSLSNLSDFKKEKRPVLVVAQNDSDFSVMKLNTESNRLSFSNFDVGGIDETNADSAFVFTDRDIYRPGETLSFGVILKSRAWDSSIRSKVYSVSLINADGTEAANTEWQPSTVGLNDFSYAIPLHAPTGEWTINVYHKTSKRSEFLATRYIRVEEFLPDTLRAEVSIDGAASQQLWTPLEKLTGTILVSQLNGFPAIDNTVQTSFTIQSARISVPQYKNYSFMVQPLNSVFVNTGNSTALKTEGSGKASFSFDLSGYGSATYRLALETLILEKEGGRSIRRFNSLIVSPRTFLVGSQNSENFFLKSTNAALSFIAVDNVGTKTAAPGLRYELLEKTTNTQLVKANGGLYEYKTVSRTVPIEIFDAPFTAGEFLFHVNTKRGGDFIVNIIDEQQTVLASSTFTVEGGVNLAVERGKTSNLDLTLITKDAIYGKEVEFFMKAPFTGNALVTIERDRVYAAKWIQVNEKNARHSITLPPNIDGNAFINVILMRDYSSPDVYTSPVSIGAANFSINRATRTNAIKLQTVKEALPGTTLEITYSTAEKSKIILYGVDEGILLFTGYKMPNPLAHFFEQKRLQVATFQNLDLFLAEFSALRKKSTDIGGDFDESLAQGLNPFARQTKKPAVFWSGILNASNETRTYKYPIPDYFNGTLKIFAVAVNEAKIGTAETSALIRDKIILSPVIPLKAAPVDEVNASIRVINNTGSADNFTLALTLPAGFKPLKNDGLTFDLEDGKEHTVKFSFTPSPTFGAYNLIFTASAKKSGIVKTSNESISVRPAVPYIKELYEEKIAPTKNKTFTNARKINPELAQMSLELSYDPFGVMQTRLDFLENYAYECSEQLMSRILPKILLSDNARFQFDKKSIQTELTEICRILNSRINGSGFLGVWQKDSQAVGFLDTYFALLINAAQQKQFTISESLVSHNTQTLADFVNMDELTDENEIRRQCYAAFLLTERSHNTSSAIERLINKIKRRNLNWKNDIASVYLATALKLLKADEQATALMTEPAKKLTVAKTDNIYDSAYVYKAQLLYVLSKYFAADSYGGTIKSLVNTVLQESTSTTINASFMIAALSETVKTFAEVPREVTVHITGFDGKTTDQKIKIGAQVHRLPLSLQTASVTVDNPDATLPLFAVFRSTGYDENRTVPTDNQGVEITRLITDKAGNKVTSAKLGDELTILVRIQAVKADAFNLAITDLLPACFEHDLSKKIHSEDSSGAAIFADKREDRMLLFTDAFKGKVIEFRYPVKVTAAGTYTLPSLFCENLYVNNSLTLTQAGTFTVKE